jgi:hypothetical protein
MADKKPDPKKAPAGKSADWFEYFFLFLLLIIGGGFGIDWIEKSHYPQLWASFSSAATYDFINIFARFAIFSFFFSIVMIIVVIMYAWRAAKIRRKILDTVTTQDTTIENIENVTPENPKWKLVEGHINSDDPNKWKLAILEADIMLADMLESLHLPGDTIADKLKAVDAGDFKTIDAAWEGHKIRNAIAHQGSDFLLNEREAKRVISLYEKVFDEFEII